MNKFYKNKKKCGILMPIFSLPSKYGIGTYGKWAYKFIDLLSECGYHYWQVLPMVETGYGDSPYSSVCDASLNPYFIDYEILRDKGLLTFREVYKYIDKGEVINYGKQYVEKYARLRLAFSKFDTKSQDFILFLKRGEFNDYAMFKTLKSVFNTPWYQWSDCYKYRNKNALAKFKNEHINEYLFWQWVQYECQNQYIDLKRYARKKNVNIIGDLPLYVSYDSVDCWVNKEDFMFDENCTPKLVAGVPPDYFSKTGQLWGNPVYDWENMKKNGYSFFKKRIARAKKYYDMVRLDHFRGYDRFWAVPYGEPTAQNGCWMDGPKMDLFNAIGTSDFIAEDLGIIDDGVRKLLSDSNICGTKVLTFAFNGDENNPYLPKNIGLNSVTYTGTHDNETMVGYFKGLSDEERNKQKEEIKKVLEQMGLYRFVTRGISLTDSVLDIAFACNSFLTIIPMHDILKLDNSRRINTPGESGCWTVQYNECEIFAKKTLSEMKFRARSFNRYYR